MDRINVAGAKLERVMNQVGTEVDGTNQRLARTGATINRDINAGLEQSAKHASVLGFNVEKISSGFQSAKLEVGGMGDGLLGFISKLAPILSFYIKFRREVRSVKTIETALIDKVRERTGLLTRAERVRAEKFAADAVHRERTETRRMEQFKANEAERERVETRHIENLTQKRQNANDNEYHRQQTRALRTRQERRKEGEFVLRQEIEKRRLLKEENIRNRRADQRAEFGQYLREYGQRSAALWTRIHNAYRRRPMEIDPGMRPQHTRKRARGDWGHQFSLFDKRIDNFDSTMETDAERAQRAQRQARQWYSTAGAGPGVSEPRRMGRTDLGYRTTPMDRGEQTQEGRKKQPPTQQMAGRVSQEGASVWKSRRLYDSAYLSWRPARPAFR